MHTPSQPIPIPQVHIRLNVFREWLKKKARALAGDSHAAKVAEWDKRAADLLLEVQQKPTVPVAIVGSTGSGKSTLLNALLGVEVLPVSSMTRCTSVITTVSYAAGSTYRARISFMSQAEWDAELKALRATLDVGSQEGETDGLEEWQGLSRAIKDKLCTVFNLNKEAIDQLPDLSKLEMDRELAACITPGGSFKELAHASARDLKNELKSFLSHEQRYWPIIKTVEITGPFQVLAYGAQLVDLPGVNDPNQAREEVTRGYLRNAPFVWLAFTTKRGMTKDIQDLLVGQKLLLQFLLDGKQDAITLVGTHADEFDPGQVCEELGLPDDASDIQILRERNRRIAAHVHRDLDGFASELGNVAKASFDDIDRLRKTLKKSAVFTVSTPAYMRLNKIGTVRKDYGIEHPDDTGIPGLLAHLAKICSQQDLHAHHAAVKRKLDLIIKEAEVFFSTRRTQLENLQGSIREQLKQLHDQLTEPRRKMDTDLEAIRTRAEMKFEARKESFRSSIEMASHRSRQSLESRFQYWRGKHWATLKACVVRYGVHTSCDGTKHNLNEDIAQPLVEAIPFTWDDFFGHYLENALAELKGELVGKSEVFLANLTALTRAVGGFNEQTVKSINKDVEVSRQNLEFHVDEKIKALNRTIERKRRDLAAGIPGTIRAAMSPAYEITSEIRGTGMKAAIIATLVSHATKCSGDIFETIQRDLSDGVTELGLQFKACLRELHEAAGTQADRILGNIGLGEIQQKTENVAATIASLQAAIVELDEMLAPEPTTNPLN